MKLDGRILYLTEDSSLIESQLGGTDLSLSADADMHYGVNTDGMISGRACTLGYTPAILGPYFLENFEMKFLVKGDSTSRMRKNVKNGLAGIDSRFFEVTTCSVY